MKFINEFFWLTSNEWKISFGREDILDLKSAAFLFNNYFYTDSIMIINKHYPNQ